MLHKPLQHDGDSDGELASFLSDPIEAAGELYEFNPVAVDNNRAGSRQKANIKKGNLYSGIQIEGDKWMHRACEEAMTSVKNGGGPFGAVLLQIDRESSRIVRYWVGRNRVTLINDPTAHAEILAIRSACHSLEIFNLGRIEKEHSRLPQPGALSYCVMYASAEPCPMCYSALCWAKIPRLFFAATRFDIAVKGVDFSDEKIHAEVSKPYSERALKVYQCAIDNSLDALNLWKKSANTPY
jgi:guanine deaminase